MCDSVTSKYAGNHAKLKLKGRVSIFGRFKGQPGDARTYKL